ncbi:MAG: (Fe-S)-binding protein [Anaerolineales bacterium]|nr:(Fe-S)-binding protein [Anaerolineales bacterium]
MKDTIALFTTCMVDQMFPEIGVAAVNLLRRTGRKVAFPPEQTCCGQPFYNSGFWPQARDLAKATIQALEPYHAVVIPGGSCAGMIRVEYAHLFEDQPDWRVRAAALGAKTFEFSEYLAANLTLSPKSEQPTPVTYHDSCHMLRVAGIKHQPRQLLEQVGCQITEMRESERCCGFGGLFSVKMQPVSKAMTAEKLSQANQTATGLLVTSDPGCLMQMRANQPLGDPLRIDHLAVVLEELAA